MGLRKDEPLLAQRRVENSRFAGDFPCSEKLEELGFPERAGGLAIAFVIPAIRRRRRCRSGRLFGTARRPVGGRPEGRLDAGSGFFLDEIPERSRPANQHRNDAQKKSSRQDQPETKSDRDNDKVILKIFFDHDAGKSLLMLG